MHNEIKLPFENGQKVLVEATILSPTPGEDGAAYDIQLKGHFECDALVEVPTSILRPIEQSKGVPQHFTRHLPECHWDKGCAEGCTADAEQAPKQALGPHDVCENSRDCIVCSQRILPAGGVCFNCHSEEVNRLKRAGDDDDDSDHGLWHGSGVAGCPPTCSQRKAGDNA